MSALIIGYGNPLRRDDGFGWEIVNRLRDGLTVKSTKVLTVHQLTPELAASISEADLVVFVDASCDGRPGSWTCETISSDACSSQALAHYFTPVTLLAYASAVFGARPRALLISAAGESFECGDSLTPKVEAAVPEIVEYLGRLVAVATRRPNSR